MKNVTVSLLLACLLLANTTLLSAKENSPPKVDHILLEVKDLNASIVFYCDLMGLHLTSQKGDFVTLEAANMGVYLWKKRWDWELSRGKNERKGLGMYPHFVVEDAMALVEKARKKGFIIIQKPRKYHWGIEAFLADPDGYIWAILQNR